MGNSRTPGRTGPTAHTWPAGNYRIAASGSNVWLGPTGVVSFGINGVAPKGPVEFGAVEFTPVRSSSDGISPALIKNLSFDAEELGRALEAVTASAGPPASREGRRAAAKPAGAVKSDREVVDSDMLIYARSLEEELSRLARGAKWRLRIYRLVRFALLVASIITPGAAIMSAPKEATIASALVIFICEGFLQITHINDRAVLDIRRLTGLGREYRMYRTRVGDYGGKDRDVLFVRRVEEIRAQGDGKILDVLQQTFSSVGESAAVTVKGPPSGGSPR